jgi:hypothetical protein
VAIIIKEVKRHAFYLKPGQKRRVKQALPAGARGRSHVGTQNNTDFRGTTMSALNGDKARFNRQRKQKLAKRERNRELRKKLMTPAPRWPSGRDL